MAEETLGQPYPLGNNRGLGPHQGLAIPVGMTLISWNAVVAGIVVGFAIQVLLMLPGLALAFGSIDPLLEARPFAGLPLGVALWWAITSLVSIFMGAWVAGRLAGFSRRFTGALHGVLTWGLATLLAMVLMGSALGAAMDSLDAERVLEPSREGLPGQPGHAADSAYRQAAINLLAARTGMGRAQVENVVDKWIRSKEQAKEGTGKKPAVPGLSVERLGGFMAEKAAQASLLSFLVLLLGGLCGSLGGMVGASATKENDAGP
jgi:hypothetical protein